MQRSPFGVAVSDPRLGEAALAALERSGTAVDACVAAFFTASALDASVVLGAASIITAGPGVGARTFDGALLQPGRAAPRPRGFREHDPIPVSATVGVSSAIVALYAAHAHDGALTLSELASPAVKLASGAGRKGRAALLRRIGASGPLATREPGFVRELLDIAGRIVGGVVTEQDLQESTAQVAPPDAASNVMRMPQVERRHVPVALDTFVVCACDSRGVLAAMHVGHDPGGVDVPTHDVKAPRSAIPVLRGVPRVTPGTPLGGPAPIALLADDAGVVWCAVGFDSAAPNALDGLNPSRAEGVTIDQSLRQMLGRDASLGRAACAVIRPTTVSGGVRSLVIPRDASI